MLLFGMINRLFTWHRPEGGLRHANLAPIVAGLFFAGVPGVRPPSGAPVAAAAPTVMPIAPATAGITPQVPVPLTPTLLTP